MSIIADSNERLAAAERRLLARQDRLRADFLAVRNSWGATLTQPLVIGGALLGGFMLSGRARRAPPPVECSCKAQRSTFFPSMLAALLVPMVEKWVGAAQHHSPDAGAARGSGQAAVSTEALMTHP
ncbi:MAG: hypothetical protein ABI537_03170 [Casimicrobiaceae bacterium]